MLSDLGGMTLAEFVYKRCALSKKADIVAIITSVENSDNKLFEHCISKNIPVFRGSMDNVLERYVRAAESYNASLICRVCGDSPFVDIELTDRMFELAETEGLDYVAPDKKLCIPGFYSEVVTLDALKRSLIDSSADDEFEHVTLHIKKNKDHFRVKNIETDLKPLDSGDVSLTVDYPEDLSLCNKILKLMGNHDSFKSGDVLAVLRKEKSLYA